MRAAIHSPYLDTLGGGERYAMAVARALINKEVSVDVEWKDPSIKKKLEDRFGVKLDGVNFIPDIKRGDGYDICFWVSDGSIPTLKARKNLLHFQFPFKDVNGRSLLNKMKLFRINRVICNSLFTKQYIDKEFGVESRVIYPPVDTASLIPGAKENLILFVGRFSQLTQAKNQHILIKAFKRLFDSGYKDFQLVLAGGVEVGVDNYINRLEKSGWGYPVKIIKSPSFKELKSLYSRAKLFWSAAGFGVNAQRQPLRLEHFGITAVEAMAAGAVPIIFNGGGHKEIVKHGEDGYLWETLGQLIKYSKTVLDDKSVWKKLSLQARGGAGRFSYESFEKNFLEIL